MKPVTTLAIIAGAASLGVAAAVFVLVMDIGAPPSPQSPEVAAPVTRSAPVVADPSANVRAAKRVEDGAAVLFDNRPIATGSVGAPLRVEPRETARVAPAAPAGPVGPYRFSARREGGLLRLTGAVPDAATRDELVRLAREQFFHERIVDETRLSDGAPPRFRDGARLALGQLAQLASGEAIIAGGSLRLEGDALYAQAADEIRDRTRQNAP
jgi:hypothetical protein